MKAYKAMKKDQTCRGFKFEEGETYELAGSPVLYEHGFHFCKELVLTLEHYPVDIDINENAYAEIEILGEFEFEKPTENKGITNKLKILRIISEDEVNELVDVKMNSGDWNSGYRNSGYGNSGDSNRGNSNSGYRNSGYRNSGNRNSGDRNSGDSNSGDSNSGYRNSGNSNSGYGNSGYSNSGDSNSGNRNSGYSNSGDSNSGYSNSGDSNSGNWNSGDRNSGNRNSGYGNSGYRNSGNRNSGDWNSCNSETGFFNSVQDKKVRVFNRSCLKSEWDMVEKPDFLYFESDEKLGYKKSFQKSFRMASEEDVKLLKALPNFDADVFFEISGIRV